jgi:AcrR family transcriptional regulator
MPESGVGTESPSDRFPRRARRKEQTRERIIESGEVLFRRIGYAEATMAVIADAADVHVATLFTHFKSKRDLSDAIAERPLDRIRRTIEENQGRTPFFEFMRALVVRAGRDYQRKAKVNLKIGRQFGVDPDVTASWMNYERRQTELLAAYIANDFELDLASDYRPTLIANMIIGGNILAHDRWVKCDGKSDLVGEVLAALGAVEELVKGGLAGAERG